MEFGSLKQVDVNSVVGCILKREMRKHARREVSPPSGKQYWSHLEQDLERNGILSFSENREKQQKASQC
jgi:hypothetical protein